MTRKSKNKSPFYVVISFFILHNAPEVLPVASYFKGINTDELKFLTDLVME